MERSKSSFRKFYGRYGDLIQQYEVSLSRMLNDILILDKQWLPNQSDFPPISWPWYRRWPSLNYEWFPWSICNGCGMPAGNAYPSGHLVPSPFLGPCLCSNCWDQIPRTCHFFTRFFTSNTPGYFLGFASSILNTHSLTSVFTAEDTQSEKLKRDELTEYMYTGLRQDSYL